MRHDLRRFLHPRALLELMQGQLVAVLEIRHEVLFQPRDRLGAVYMGVDLEVAEKAPHVHVRRAHRGEQPVDDHDLGVDEALAVAVDAHARHEQILDIGERGVEDQLGVRSMRQDDAHVHAAQRRRPQAHEHARVWDEVRRRDVHLFLGRADGGKDSFQDGVGARIRPAGDDLHLLFADAAVLRQVLRLFQPLPRGKPPIPHEDEL